MITRMPDDADAAIGMPAWAPALPETPEGWLQADLVSRIANELFRETPLAVASTPAPASPFATAMPGVGGGPLTPVATGVPTLGDAPLEGAIDVAPAMPGSWGSWAAPTLTGLAPAVAPSAALSTSVPIGEVTPSGYTAGTVPSVGEGAFLRDIPHGVDVGSPAWGSASMPGADGLPFGEAELLGFGLQGLSGPGTPAATDSVSQFYFLPAPAIAAEPDAPARFDVHAVREDFPALHQQVHGKPLVWLDNAATTHKPQSVIDAEAYFYAHDNSNIHRGAHTLAARATDAYEGARDKVRRLLGAKSTAEIIFTRGSTESINLVAQSYGRRFIGPGDEILITTLEHHSNIVPWQFLCQQTGASLKVIPIDEQGQVVLEAYERLLSPRTKLVAFAHVSNVLGTVLPVNVMVEMAHRNGAKVLVDGAQGAPHVPVNVLAFDADFYVFSGHKLFAPTGIGVLYGKEEILEAMPPWQGGGSMIDSVSFDHTTFSPLPAKFEAGTPHIAGAVGLGAAIDYVHRYGMEIIAAYEEGLMSYGTSALSGIPGLRQIGTTPGKVGALTFVIDGMDTAELGQFLDREGIAVRAGHHCAQPALARYGLQAAVRASISLYNTTEDIDRLIAALHKAIAAK